MATINCEVIIKKDGQVIQVQPSTNKTLAKMWGSRKAKEIGGEYQVKPVTPYEFKPE